MRQGTGHETNDASTNPNHLVENRAPNPQIRAEDAAMTMCKRILTTIEVGQFFLLPCIFWAFVEWMYLVLSASDRERSKSPTPTPQPSSAFPVPLPPKLKKQPSFTMPGALFPRSPSLLPDQYAQTTLDLPTSVQVPHPPHNNKPDEVEAGPSWSHPHTAPSAHVVDPAEPSLDDYVSPWRTRSVASVKDAVHRFSATDGVEADFSLMLPSPHASPVKPVSKTRSAAESSPQHPNANPAPTRSSRKGKERARNDDDLEFIVGGSSGQEDVYAKERELDAAREEQREHERRSSRDQSRRASDERERDKRRIRALEEEVKWLKGEVKAFSLLADDVGLMS